MYVGPPPPRPQGSIGRTNSSGCLEAGSFSLRPEGECPEPLIHERVPSLLGSREAAVLMRGENGLHCVASGLLRSNHTKSMFITSGAWQAFGGGHRTLLSPQAYLGEAGKLRSGMEARHPGSREAIPHFLEGTVPGEGLSLSHSEG